MAICQKGNAMLSVYLVSILAAVLFAISLRSFWAGVLGFVLVLSSCDLAAYCAKQGQYVGPIRLIQVVEEAINQVVVEMSVAEKKGLEYDRCMDHFLNKAWGENQTIPSQQSLHHQCIKVAAERSLP